MKKLKKTIKKVGHVVAGSGLAVGMFYMPEAFANLLTAPDIPLGTLVDSNEKADVMIKKIFGYMFMFVAIVIGIASLIFLGIGAVSGFNKLQDSDNYPKYTVGTWIVTIVIGLLTVAIAYVISNFIFGFGSAMLGATGLGA